MCASRRSASGLAMRGGRGASRGFDIMVDCTTGGFRYASAVLGIDGFAEWRLLESGRHEAWSAVWTARLRSPNPFLFRSLQGDAPRGVRAVRGYGRVWSTGATSSMDSPCKAQKSRQSCCSRGTSFSMASQTKSEPTPA